MAKKIIFIGPPAAGKTSLRKIFFEGENSSRLLEYALEPTHGKESIVLKLQEEIGIVDLAGQENQFWLEMNKNSIFYSAEIVIIVIDITNPIEEIINFAKRVLKIRNELNPTSIVYLLLHKVDLLKPEKLKEIKLNVNNELFQENLLKISYTSIQRDYFTQTFGLFIDILKTCVNKKVAKAKSNINFFKNTINILYIIQEKVPISKDELINFLKIPRQNTEQIIDMLDRENLINISIINQKETIKLTTMGALYIKNLLYNFTVEDFSKIKGVSLEFKPKEVDKSHAFLGFMIGDKDGKPILITELHDGFFDLFLQAEDREKPIAFELIPMFISALEKFSDEINIKNLPGFTLKGTNIKIQTFNFEMVTVTLFMNSNTDFKSTKKHIEKWFLNLIETNKKDIEYSIETGNVTKIRKLKNTGRKWLQDLNMKYKLMALNHDIFDMKQTKELYQKLDDLSNEKNSFSPKIQKKILKLKQGLVRASLDEDFQSIKEISKKIMSLDL